MLLKLQKKEISFYDVYCNQTWLIIRAVLDFFRPPASRVGKVEMLPAQFETYQPEKKWKGNFLCSGAYDSIFDRFTTFSGVR